MQEADKPTTVFHTRHACGHSVYWGNPMEGFRTAPYPCPWCGAATGTFRPDGDVILISGTLVFRELLPDGRVPWPSELPQTDKVFVQHMTGNVCCEVDGRNA